LDLILLSRFSLVFSRLVDQPLRKTKKRLRDWPFFPNWGRVGQCLNWEALSGKTASGAAFRESAAHPASRG